MPHEDNQNEPNGDWNSEKFQKNLFFCYVFNGQRAEAIHHCGQLIFETMYVCDMQRLVDFIICIDQMWLGPSHWFDL